MQIDSQCVWRDIQAIKKFSLLVRHIISVVTECNNNGLLAIGTSPIMPHALNEAVNQNVLLRCTHTAILMSLAGDIDAKKHKGLEDINIKDNK